MKFDVIMLTRNSSRFLKNVLTSVYREIPVCHLIVVDGFSSDNTLDIINNYPNVKVVQTYASLGKAREIGIKLVDTEWFIFIDSDIVLNQGWLNVMLKYIDDDVGAVEGLELPMMAEIRAWREGMAKIRKKFRISYDPQKSRRAFTGDTLIRTEAVRDINIPSYLRVYEDQYIKNYIERKGYRWIVTREYVCRHYDFKAPHRTFIAGEIAFRMGYLSLKKAFTNFLKSIPLSLIAYYYSRVWRVIPYHFKWYFYYFTGALRGKFKGRFHLN